MQPGIDNGYTDAGKWMADRSRRRTARLGIADISPYYRSGLRAAIGVCHCNVRKYILGAPNNVAGEDFAAYRQGVQTEGRQRTITNIQDFT
jgi:hypothetical protein